MKIRAFNNWSRRGYKIKRGARAIGFNRFGEPLFSRGQVTYRPHQFIPYMPRYLGMYEW